MSTPAGLLDTSDITADFEDILDGGVLPPDDQEATLQAAVLREAAELIDGLLGGRFIVAPQLASVYDAPAGSILNLCDGRLYNDLIKSGDAGAVVVTLYGETVDPGSYTLRLNKWSTGYDRIVLLAGAAWDDGVRSPYGAITVTGDHGVAAAMPDVVKRAYAMVATRLYDRRILRYRDSAGHNDFNTINAGDLLDQSLWMLVRKWKRRPTRQIVRLA